MASRRDNHQTINYQCGFFHNLVQPSPYQKLFDIFVVGYNAIMNCHKFYKKEKTTNIEKEK